MDTEKSATITLLFAALLLLLLAGQAFAGCGSAVVSEQGEPEEYPFIQVFRDACVASEAAGFEIRTPGYTMDGKLEEVELVEMAPGHEYANLYYPNGLLITEHPLDGTRSCEASLAEHQAMVDKLPPHLRTTEEPASVEVAGHKGLLWMHKDGIIFEQREGTGITSFHAPYLVWWDESLEYRLIVDDCGLYETDPEAGIQELFEIAESMYDD